MQRSQIAGDSSQPLHPWRRRGQQPPCGFSSHSVGPKRLPSASQPVALERSPDSNAAREPAAPAPATIAPVPTTLPPATSGQSRRRHVGARRKAREAPYDGRDSRASLARPDRDPRTGVIVCANVVGAALAGTVRDADVAHDAVRGQVERSERDGGQVLPPLFHDIGRGQQRYLHPLGPQPHSLQPPPRISARR